MTPYSSKAQGLHPFRSPEGDERFVQQSACAVCPVPANAPTVIFYCHSSGFLSSMATLHLWPRSVAEPESDQLYIHSPPSYSTICPSDLS